MKLEELKTNWEGLGESDPFWAVLTNPAKINNGWDKEEFFETGKNWIIDIISKLSLEEKINYNNALDFGCGPGRLTQALSQKFNNVIGVDISASMIENAKSLNRFPESCKYLVNSKNDLSQLPSNHFDFVLSYITLQHINPIYTVNYIKEFTRVATADGFILFNHPAQPPLFLKILTTIIGLRGVNLIRKIYYKKKHVIEMHWIKEKEMLDLFKQIGLEVINITQDNGVGNSWKSNLYLLRKIK